jgi:hypothetical protein
MMATAAALTGGKVKEEQRRRNCWGTGKIEHTTTKKAKRRGKDIIIIEKLHQRGHKLHSVLHVGEVSILQLHGISVQHVAGSGLVFQSTGVDANTLEQGV